MNWHDLPGIDFILGERTASYNAAKVGDGKSLYVEQGRVKVLLGGYSDYLDFMRSYFLSCFVGILPNF